MKTDIIIVILLAAIASIVSVMFILVLQNSHKLEECSTGEELMTHQNDVVSIVGGITEYCIVDLENNTVAVREGI